MTQELGPLQEKWLSLLESGEFEQGKGYLEKNGKFCCLGIACSKVLDLTRTRQNKEIKAYYTYENYFNSTFMPGTSYEEIGLYSNSGMTFERYGKSLADMNDEGRTFKEIAAIIRADPKNYFSEPK